MTHAGGVRLAVDCGQQVGAGVLGPGAIRKGSGQRPKGAWKSICLPVKPPDEN